MKKHQVSVMKVAEPFFEAESQLFFKSQFTKCILSIDFRKRFEVGIDFSAIIEKCFYCYRHNRSLMDSMFHFI